MKPLTFITFADKSWFLLDQNGEKFDSGKDY